MTTASPTAAFALDRRPDGAAVVWLEAPHQSVVVMDRVMLARLDATIDALEASPPSMVIIRSRDQRVWVAGADLKEIDSLSDDELEAYLAEGQRVFGRIASLPFPVIAAVCGATLGGGLELAMHCHGVVACVTSMRGKPYPIGLPEASLGLVPGWGGTQLMPARVPPDVSLPAMAAGKPFLSSELPEDLVDATVDDPDALEQACVDLAATLDPTDLPRTIASCDEEMLLAAVDHIRHDPAATEAGKIVAHCVATGVKDGLPEGLEMEREGLVSLRNTEHTRGLLHAFLNPAQ
ncbi:MAG: enoyl-CoA hydratase/isomerase family protein [Phycisphaerales bacterium]|jgi:enoyl-CoA hydratase/carnithine racemase|nr:enoyl-CoA hydratase/isomerase family protein [Phycisphaerales bacterium]